MHNDENCFITLTYSDQNLPKHNSLKKSHFQKFIRSLRKTTAKKIRFYMCGEYGDRTNRPHYHAILFGYKFPDTYLWGIRNDNRVYRSPLLEQKWTHGHSEIGSVTFKSAAYVARYIMKKQNGENAKTHYAVLNLDGEIIGQRLPEYTNMSLKPGIGKSWYDKHKMDLFPHDYAVTPDGRKMPTPTYYRELLKKEQPDLYETLRNTRIEKARNNPNNTTDRLAVREQCQQAKLSRLIRPIK